MFPIGKRIALMGGAPWTPAKLLSGNLPALWLRADTGVYTDAAKTIPAASDGAVIYTWANQLGAGSDAVQADPNSRPLWKLAIRNGRPVLRFDGSDDLLTGTLAGLGGNASKTIFAAGSYTSSAPGPFWALGENLNLATLGLGVTTTPTWSLYQWGAGNDLGDGVADTNFHVLCGIKDGNNLYHYLDGALTVGPEAHAVANITSTNYWIAAAVGGFTILMACDIAEIIVYGSALPITDRRKVERYLGQRYAVAV